MLLNRRCPACYNIFVMSGHFSMPPLKSLFLMGLRSIASVDAAHFAVIAMPKAGSTRVLNGVRVKHTRDLAWPYDQTICNLPTTAILEDQY